MTTRFSDVGPAEEIVLTFDYAAELPAGTTLDTPTVVVEVDRGVDPAAAAIVVAAQVIDATVLVPVAGMLADTDYHITCTCTTSTPELTLTRAGVLPCRRL